ncbi:MAG: DUF6588 family protein [candidate division KSB1 bacterium]|nr:DUF6588 family protein [candidate division KSB1 bacterium]
MKRTLFLCLLSLLLIKPAFAQIEESLQDYSEANARGYIQPFVDGTATSMNRGWYQTAKVPAFGIRVRVGLITMLAPVVDADKTFMAETRSPFYPQQSVETSTVVGPPDATYVSGYAGTQYSFPGGYDLESTGFVVPQLTLGTVLGTEASVRYISLDFEDSYIENLTVTGFGVRHSLSQYLLLSPVDVSVGGFWQTLSINKDLLEFSTFHAGLQAGRQFGMLELYAGVGYDQSSVDIKYVSNPETDESISFSMDGESGMQYTVGLGFDFKVMHLSADLSFGMRPIYTAGLFVGL